MQRVWLMCVCRLPIFVRLTFTLKAPGLLDIVVQGKHCGVLIGTSADPIVPASRSWLQLNGDHQFVPASRRLSADAANPMAGNTLAIQVRLGFF